MKKNGFTLVEILSVLVLLGLIMGLAVPGISRISSRMKEKSLKTKIELIESAAILWGQDNKSLLKEYSWCNVGEVNYYSCNKVTIKTLIEDNYLDTDTNSGKYENPANGKDFASDNSCKVHVYKKNNRVYAYFSEATCNESID